MNAREHKNTCPLVCLLVRAVGHFNISVVVFTSKQDIYLPSYGIRLRHDESHGLRNQLCSLIPEKARYVMENLCNNSYHLNCHSVMLHLRYFPFNLLQITLQLLYL